jgi:hypothetical protein
MAYYQNYMLEQEQFSFNCILYEKKNIIVHFLWF